MFWPLFPFLRTDAWAAVCVCGPLPQRSWPCLWTACQHGYRCLSGTAWHHGNGWSSQPVYCTYLNWIRLPLFYTSIKTSFSTFVWHKIKALTAWIATHCFSCEENVTKNVPRRSIESEYRLWWAENIHSVVYYIVNILHLLISCVMVMWYHVLLTSC